MLVTTVLGICGVLLLIALALWLVGERGRFLCPSTWQFLREGGLRRFVNLSTLHGYIYGRWTKQYIKLLLTGLARASRVDQRVAHHYHGKVLTPEQARSIITLDRDIPLRDLEQIIPYPVARDLVLKAPSDVAAYECACRAARANSCQPTQVCMVIGQPFVDFVLEHHPKRSRRLNQTEALRLLQAEHERGHLHSAWFKDAMLGRFYAVCNCCKCCCGGIEAMTKYGVPMFASSGYVSQVDEALCTACSICQDACPFEAISVDGTAKVNWQVCMGCGVCLGKCPCGALSLVRDGKKGLPLDVHLLAQDSA